MLIVKLLDLVNLSGEYYCGKLRDVYIHSRSDPFINVQNCDQRKLENILKLGVFVAQTFLFLSTIFSITPIIGTREDRFFLLVLRNQVQVDDNRKYTKPNRKREVESGGSCVTWGVGENPSGDNSSQVAVYET